MLSTRGCVLAFKSCQIVGSCHTTCQRCNVAIKYLNCLNTLRRIEAKYRRYARELTNWQCREMKMIHFDVNQIKHLGIVTIAEQKINLKRIVPQK